MKRSKRDPDLELSIPPREKPLKEPEEGSRLLHGLAGLLVGAFLGGAIAKGVWRGLGIHPANTILVSSLLLAAAGAIWRGRLWRWLKM